MASGRGVAWTLIMIVGTPFLSREEVVAGVLIMVEREGALEASGGCGSLCSGRERTAVMVVLHPPVWCVVRVVKWGKR